MGNRSDQVHLARITLSANAPSQLAGQTSQPQNCQSIANDVNSDAFWVEMLREQGQRIIESESSSIFNRFQNSDPLRCEVKAADRRGILDAIRSSYAKRDHTLFWSIFIFVFATLALIPFLGFLGAPLFSILVSALWAAVHGVRRC